MEQQDAAKKNPSRAKKTKEEACSTPLKQESQKQKEKPAKKKKEKV
jgi:hypothetical protein